MKGLFKTFLIIVILVAVGFTTSAFIYVNLDDKLTSEFENGYERGLADGHREGFAQGGIAGFQEGSKAGYVTGNKTDNANSEETGTYFLFNPTYEEVEKLLADRKQHLTNSELDSAMEIQDYAEANGIRSAYVRCEIARKTRDGLAYNYELAAFETIDRGLIIIDPLSHQEVKLKVGEHYSELNSFPLQNYDDTITKITTVW